MLNEEWMETATTQQWFDNNLSTVEQVAQHIISQYSTGELIQLRTICEQDPSAEMDFTRFVRNRYLMWWTHPLTQNWRDNESTRDIIEGVDYSEDHPDNVSAVIVFLVLQMLNTSEQC